MIRSPMSILSLSLAVVCSRAVHHDILRFCARVLVTSAVYGPGRKEAVCDGG